ncbi:uncharacterized protein BJ171DRAFT_31834 [Polychytrium aggregatum]|uniref:uncharacterized protein n=1 Tax=Polychytrium aggregatum TaxID=110093 RepID=UPI0022FDB105|nr:uncharacterized protein BJ171DRAFT_31834 [Polychytrium aggregatum]KAI9206511.1 hypothetical protein BJ171DRAFT_31834 [Polychytrium aggregatum]
MALARRLRMAVPVRQPDQERSRPSSAWGVGPRSDRVRPDQILHCVGPIASAHQLSTSVPASIMSSWFSFGSSNSSRPTTSSSPSNDPSGDYAANLMNQMNQAAEDVLSASSTPASSQSEDKEALKAAIRQEKAALDQLIRDKKADDKFIDQGAQANCADLQHEFLKCLKHNKSFTNVTPCELQQNLFRQCVQTQKLHLGKLGYSSRLARHEQERILDEADRLGLSDAAAAKESDRRP